jgi:hypothetical protein
MNILNKINKKYMENLNIQNKLCCKFGILLNCRKVSEDIMTLTKK